MPLCYGYEGVKFREAQTLREFYLLLLHDRKFDRKVNAALEPVQNLQMSAFWPFNCHFLDQSLA